jgi:glycopeptide antibiotics resistance protein
MLINRINIQISALFMTSIAAHIVYNDLMYECQLKFFIRANGKHTIYVCMFASVVILLFNLLWRGSKSFGVQILGRVINIPYNLIWLIVLFTATIGFEFLQYYGIPEQFGYRHGDFEYVDIFCNFVGVLIPFILANYKFVRVHDIA